jgi:hypothetical protein
MKKITWYSGSSFRALGLYLKDVGHNIWFTGICIPLWKKKGLMIVVTDATTNQWPSTPVLRKVRMNGDN